MGLEFRIFSREIGIGLYYVRVSFFESEHPEKTYKIFSHIEELEDII